MRVLWLPLVLVLVLVQDSVCGEAGPDECSSMTVLESKVKVVSGRVMSQRRHTTRESRVMSSTATGPWRKFQVLPSRGGCAEQVQAELSLRLTRRGHHRVHDPEDCDYHLVFCPISSRVGTDISDTERSLPGDKPVVLVVLHHTFNPEYMFRPSKHLVERPNVVLTVDLLFHQGALLRCPQNEQAWASVEQLLGGAESGRSVGQLFIIIGIAGAAVFIIGLYVTAKILTSTGA